ncbi:MAG: methytransferase partner Trm112 [Tepidiformaceae bacterium]|tara:strand:- start:329 stop:508 length:180 start_codon:yes stop_codon:yes gene_type:complete
MNPELLEIIVCPTCKGSLVLTEPQQGDIIEGTLYCKACDEQFPIKDGIPNLIPPELRND